jgi:hypothetical protein
MAPEDRLDERAVTHETDDYDTLGARAALGAALVAGLVRGVQDEPPIRLHQLDTQRDTFRLFRTFGRLVMGPPDFESDLRARIDQIRTHEARMAECVDGLPAANAEQQVSNMANAFAARADQGALGFRPYTPEPMPEPQRVTWRTVLRMLREFAKDFVKRQSRKPFEAAQRAADAAVQRANVIVFGRSSAFKLVLSEDDDGGVKTASTAHEVLSRDRDSEVYIAAQPKVWSELRSTVFSLVDGSEMDEWLPAATFNGRPYVVAQPRLLAPYPSESDTLPALTLGSIRVPAVNRACDAKSAVNRRQILTPLAGYPGNSPSGEVEDDQSAEADGDTEDAENSVEKQLEELEAWEEARRSAFTYIVATRLAQEISDAERAVQRDFENVESLVDSNLGDEGAPTEESTSTVRKRRHRVRRSLRVISVALGFVLLLTAPAIALVLGLIGVLVWLILQVGVIAFAAYRLVRRVIRRMQSEFHESHRLYLQAWQADQITNALLHNSEELLRLSARYVELLEWSDLIAQVVHQPLAHSAGSQSGPVMQLSGPRAMATADAGVDQARLEHLASQLSGRLFKRGWLTQLFFEWSRQANRQSRYRYGRDDETQGLDADYDVAAMRGDVSRLQEALNVEMPTGRLDAGIDRFLSDLDSAELFEESVTVRKTGAPELLVQFLSSIKAGDTEEVTPFDKTLCNGPGNTEMRKVDLIWPTTDDMKSSPESDSPSQGIVRASWRVDVSKAVSVDCLRQGDTDDVPPRAALDDIAGVDDPSMPSV